MSADVDFINEIPKLQQRTKAYFDDRNIQTETTFSTSVTETTSTSVKELAPNEITPEDFRFINKPSIVSENFGHALAYRAAWISGFLDIIVTSLNQLIQRESKTISATDPTSELSNKTGAFATQLGFLGGWGFLWTNAFNGFRKLFTGQGKQNRAYKVAHDLGIFGILVGANILFVLGISGFTIASGLCIAFVILPWVGVFINLMLILRGILRMKRTYEAKDKPQDLLAQLYEKWKLALDITPNAHFRYPHKIKLHRVIKYEINTRLLENLLLFYNMLPKHSLGGKSEESGNFPTKTETKASRSTEKEELKNKFTDAKEKLKKNFLDAEKINYAKLTKIIAKEFDDSTDVSYRNYRYFLNVVSAYQECKKKSGDSQNLLLEHLAEEDILKQESKRFKKKNTDVGNLALDEHPLDEPFLKHLNKLDQIAKAYAFNLITAQGEKFKNRTTYFVLGTICSLTFIALSIIGFLLTTNIAGVSLFAFSAFTLAVLKIASGTLAISVLACMGGFSFLSIKGSVDDYSKWKTASERNKTKLKNTKEIFLKLKCLLGEEKGGEKENNFPALRSALNPQGDNQAQINIALIKEELRNLLSYHIIPSAEKSSTTHPLLSEELWQRLQDNNTASLPPLRGLLERLKNLCETQENLYEKKGKLLDTRRDATILKSVGTGIFLVSSFLIVTAPLLSAAALLPLAVAASLFIAIGIVLFIRGAVYANQIRILEKEIEAAPSKKDANEEELVKIPALSSAIPPSLQLAQTTTPQAEKQIAPQTQKAESSNETSDAGFREKTWKAKKDIERFFRQEPLAASSSSHSLTGANSTTPPPTTPLSNAAAPSPDVAPLGGGGTPRLAAGAVSPT